jgi:hypothetical protein
MKIYGKEGPSFLFGGENISEVKSYLKYDSSRKTFKSLSSTKSITIEVDGIILKTS